MKKEKQNWIEFEYDTPGYDIIEAVNTALKDSGLEFVADEKQRDDFHYDLVETGMENDTELTFDNQPNWLPLENFSEKYPNQINCCDFMHMGRVGGINLYKNRVSRGYINIDSEGNCYLYCSGTYLQINDESAIRRQS